ncbi:hypothetical protein LR48_Vigan09g117900 [Vigna angularis]|uniref:LOB domain-containing protein n=1 Tax=Phaseolus angularis TaxID=3914 RepID=A0A0L9VBT4_PHAAN|nr:hypothetical protein LR48_Vigan09g117900 [Vigna angularis]
MSSSLSSSNSPCAACKIQRRKCTQECVFAPYFTPDNPQRFAYVHKVFGASNVAKLLNELNAAKREDGEKVSLEKAECMMEAAIAKVEEVVKSSQVEQGKNVVVANTPVKEECELVVVEKVPLAGVEGNVPPPGGSEGGVGSGEGNGEGAAGEGGEGVVGEGNGEGFTGEGVPGDGGEGVTGEGDPGDGGEGVTGKGVPGDGGEGVPGEGVPGDGGEGVTGGVPEDGGEGVTGEGEGVPGDGGEGVTGEGVPGDGGEGVPGDGGEGVAGVVGERGEGTNGLQLKELQSTGSEPRITLSLPRITHTKPRNDIQSTLSAAPLKTSRRLQKGLDCTLFTKDGITLNFEKKVRPH